MTVTYAGYSLSNQQIMGGELHEDKEKLDPSTNKDLEKQSEQQVQETAKEEKEEKDADDDTSEEPSFEDVKLASKFHVFMACSACYMAMLLTSWGATVTQTGAPASYDVSTENLWIKIVTQWIAAGLYTWTLTAPYIFPDREFA